MNHFDEQIQICMAEMASYRIKINELEKKNHHYDEELASLRTCLFQRKKSLAPLLGLFCLSMLGLQLSINCLPSYNPYLIVGVFDAFILLCHAVKKAKIRIKQRKDKNQIQKKIQIIETEKRNIREEILKLRKEHEKVNDTLVQIKTSKSIAIEQLLERYYPGNEKEKRLERVLKP